MSLQDIQFEPVYNPGMDGVDIVQDFLLPSLSQAISYKRVAGYFSSTALATAAQGISHLVSRGGRMELITSHSFTRSDFQTLSETEANQVLQDELIESFISSWSSLDSLEGAIQRRHVEAMCWMLREGFLLIKVIVPEANGEIDLSENRIETFHPKFGLIEDEMGNVVTFSGSANESMNAWKRNLENLMIHESWIAAKEPYVAGLEKTWKAYWNGSGISGWRCIELPEAVKQRIVNDFAPEDFPDDLVTETATKGDHLWSFQRTAVDKWVKNGRRGVFEMATGTGKTKTAAECIRVTQEEFSLLTIVIVPYQHIGDQWVSELDTQKPIQADGSSNWRLKLREANNQRLFGRTRNLTVVAVQDTAASKAFLELARELSQSFDKFLLVGDEVHWLGGRTFRRSLMAEADFRLGLSATPERYFDEDGTAVIRDYFGTTVQRFTLRQALELKRPGSSETVLCPYKYIPVLVELDEEEEKKVSQLSRSIAILLNQDRGPDTEKRLFDTRLARSRVFKKAKNKIPALRKLLADGVGTDLKHCIIYCEDMEQMGEVRLVLDDLNIFFQMITGQQDAGKSKRWGDISERQHYIRNFESGHLAVLLAIDCLDEGVDIPSAQTGIILASSGNSKEFIQRRGRLMRRSPGKELATIYDMAVTSESSDEGTKQDLIRQREIHRVTEFAEDAVNSEEVFAKYGKAELV